MNMGCIVCSFTQNVHQPRLSMNPSMSANSLSCREQWHFCAYWNEMLKLREKNGPLNELLVCLWIHFRSKNPRRRMTKPVVKVVQMWINMIKLSGRKEILHSGDQLLFIKNQNDSQSRHCQNIYGRKTLFERSIGVKNEKDWRKATEKEENTLK